MAAPASVADPNLLNYYGDGANASVGQQSKTFFYDRALIISSNKNFTFRQFCVSKDMIQKSGKQYRISVFHPMYLRMPYTDDTWNDMTKKTFSEDFQKYGYMSGRDLADLTNGLYGLDGKGYPTGTYNNNGIRLLEGEGPANKVTLKKSTYIGNLERFGEMIEYTDEITLFSEDSTQMIMRSQLGEKASSVMEDLIMLDMLSTPSVIYSGPALSKETMGNGIGNGAVDAITKTNAVEQSYKVSWELFQAIGDRLLKNRAPKFTKILTGSVKIGTIPISACYVAIVSNNIKVDLENIGKNERYTGTSYQFNRVETYASNGSIMENEFGRLGEFRFIYSDRLPVERGAGALVEDDYTGNLSYSTVLGTDNQTEEKHFDLFPILIPTEGSFATLNLVGNNKVNFTSKAPQDIDKTDPFGTKGFFAYNFWYGSVILHPEWLMKAYVLATGSGNN